MTRTLVLWLLALPAQEPAWTDLFDGRTLAGWTAKGGKATYRAENGEIVGATAPEGPNTFLCTDRAYDHFELELEVKCDPALNSGIQVRSRVYEKDTPQRSDPTQIREAGSVYGPQVEVTTGGVAGRIWDEGRDRKWRDAEPSAEAKAAYRPGEWNRFRILAVGARIRTWVNDVPVADAPLEEDHSGFIGLQVHRVAPGKGPYEVRWRKLRLRPVSVNPAVNKPLEKAKAKDFVERWEREGREVYDRREEIAAACGLKPGMRVADVGAGSGLFTRIFARAVGETGKVYAVDIVEDFVRHVEKTSKEAGLANVEGVVCAADDAKLPPGSVDLAFICDTYHHFEFPTRTMRSIHRALRPGGRVVMVEFVREPGRSSEWVMNHVRAGQAVFTREIEESGFRLLEEKKLLKENYVLVFEKLPSGVRFEKRVLNEAYVSDGVTAGDLNRDGKPDMVAGPWWWEGPEFRTKREIYPPVVFETAPSPTDSMFSYVHDFNGDGWSDVLRLGRVHLHEACWFENPAGGSGPWKRHFVFERIFGESPPFLDADGDGKPELVCHWKDRWGLLKPDPKGATLPWVFHPVTPPGKYHHFYHGTGIGDVNGDGRPDLLLAEGWFAQGAPGVDWAFHPFRFGTKGGAQMFALDADGDGDRDVLTALDAHGWGLAWFEQVQEGGKASFREHRIMGDRSEEKTYGAAFSQPHALDVADLDGDGLDDLIVGKRRWAHGPKGDVEPDAAPVVYWFRLEREGGKARFVPRLIDDASGVGVQIRAADVDGDGRPDVLTASKLGTFLFLNRPAR